MIEISDAVHYISVTGETDDIPGAVREALKDATTETDYDRVWEVSMWGPFGYKFGAEFGDDGICNRYRASKTGYDGDFRIEGRGYTRDVLAILDLFFTAGKA